METVIYQMLGLLLGVAVIKVIQFIQYWNERRKFRKEFPKMLERMKRNTEREMKMTIMMCSLPFLVSAYLKKKKEEEEAKLKDERSQNCT